MTILCCGPKPEADKGPEKKMMILFGPPGCGKGTVSPGIESQLSIPQLSTGDMLRAAVAAGTEVGKTADELMKAGKLVPDEVVIGVIKDRIQEDDCKNGCIFDGFPRTVAQAKALDSMLADIGCGINVVLQLD
eukprot:gene655-206_t